MRSAALLAIAVLGGCASVLPPQTPPLAVTAPKFSALGTEPFWSLVAANGTLTWTSPEMPVGRPVTARTVKLAHGWFFAGKLDDRALELTVSDTLCSDGMSDRAYPYTARVTKGSELLRGCAY